MVRISLLGTRGSDALPLKFLERVEDQRKYVVDDDGTEAKVNQGRRCSNTRGLADLVQYQFTCRLLLRSAPESQSEFAD